MTRFYRLFTEDTRTDDLGRRQFFLFWKNTRDGSPYRGQIFFTNPDEQTVQLHADGHTVEVIDDRHAAALAREADR